MSSSSSGASWERRRNPRLILEPDPELPKERERGLPTVSCLDHCRWSVPTNNCHRKSFPRTHTRARAHSLSPRDTGRVACDVTAHHDSPAGVEGEAIVNNGPRLHCWPENNSSYCCRHNWIAEWSVDIVQLELHRIVISSITKQYADIIHYCILLTSTGVMVL